MNSLPKIITLLLISTICITGCKKTAGPKGDTGATGSQGPSGTSNMQIQTFTTATTDWTSYSWPYEYVEAVFNIPAITSTVVSNGDVRVYMLDPTGTSWMGMPYSYVTNQYSYKYKSGQVIVDLTLSSSSPPANPGVQQFKVVVIPPGFVKKNPEVNWNNYNEVIKKLNLTN